MSIGSNIKKYRLEAGMTLDEVAQKVGISRQTMSRYETGVISNIPSDKLEAIARVLGINPSLLMEWAVQWREDIYEDYQAADSDSVRRQILKSCGIPADMMGEAKRLLFSDSAIPDRNDSELTMYLEELRSRPEMRMLFSVAKDATKEDVEKAVAIIEALRKTEGK